MTRRRTEADDGTSELVLSVFDAPLCSAEDDYAPEACAVGARPEVTVDVGPALTLYLVVARTSGARASGGTLVATGPGR